MEFSTFTITNKGQALMAKLMLGTGKMRFTAIRTSSTAYAQQDLLGLTALSNIKQTATISDVVAVNNVSIRIRGAIDNSELTTGYNIQTIGVYATDPDEGEILYAVARALTSGYMPPNNGVTASGANFDFIPTVASASTVLQIDPAGVATLTDVLLLQNEIGNLKGFVVTLTLIFTVWKWTLPTACSPDWREVLAARKGQDLMTFRPSAGGIAVT